jgi:FMN phosphatase YigB (HAD superfamily)
MPVTFVYFDLGNVLLKFDNQRACRQMAERMEIPIESLCALFQEKDYPRRLELGTVTVEEVYADLCRAFGNRCSLHDVKYAGCDMFQVNQAMVPLVTRLVVAGVRVGILSNTSSAHWEFITDGRFRFINDLFEQYALSFQIGAMKPAAGIYTAAARLAGCDPASIFFMDDHAENVQGASDAGWQAVPFQSPHQLAEEMRQSGLRFWY